MHSTLDGPKNVYKNGHLMWQKKRRKFKNPFIFFYFSERISFFRVSPLFDSGKLKDVQHFSANPFSNICFSFLIKIKLLFISYVYSSWKQGPSHSKAGLYFCMKGSIAWLTSLKILNSIELQIVMLLFWGGFSFTSPNTCNILENKNATLAHSHHRPTWCQNSRYPISADLFL